jgi:hypothetical protein
VSGRGKRGPGLPDVAVFVRTTAVRRQPSRSVGVTLPNFPTDNLYKFMALIGAALVVVSVAFPLTQLTAIEARVDELQGESDVLGFEVSRLAAETQRDLVARAAPDRRLTKENG